MIKAVVLPRKLPHLSDEEFRRFWLEEHGSLVRSHARARRIRKYVQLHPTGPEILEAITRRRDNSSL